tara:strand:+ start:2526 stop:5147 length:2622 start_codon:yes stop_codon:yes gene_type:complete
VTRFPAILFLLTLHSSSAVWGQWNLVQDALPSGANCIQITSDAFNQRGAAWHTCPLHLGASFHLEFEVNLGMNNNGADGICFVLQQVSNESSGPLSTNGAQIGYGSTDGNGVFGSRSLAIEIDTFANDGSPGTGDDNQSDPASDHIAIFRDGSLQHNSPNELSAAVQAHPVDENIETGINYPLDITWNAATMLLEVYFDGSLRHSLTIDLVADLFDGNPFVFWGFTGSTGGLSNTQSFCDNSLYYSSYMDGLAVQEPSPLVACVGDTVSFTAQPLTPTVDVLWDTSNDSVIDVTAGGSYAMTGFNSAGCPTHETFDVEILDPALQLLIDSDLTICGGSEATLSATAAPNATIAWDGVEGTTSVTSEPGIHEVTATVGACSTALEVNVTFQPLPQINFALDGVPTAGPIVICEGDAIEVEAVPSMNAVAFWEGSETHLLTVNGSGTFVATSLIGGCESNPQSIEIQTLPLPEGSFSASPQSLCWETTGEIGFDLFNDAFIVSWDLPSGTTDLSEAGAGVYTAHLIHNNGCEANATFTYNMLPPIATGLSNPLPLCDNDVVTLNVTGNVDAVSWNVGGDDATLPVVSSMGSGPFVANVELGACTQSDTAYVTWWPTPSVGTQPDTVNRCVLDAPYSFVWPTQMDAPVGSWVWSVNDEPATSGYSAFEEGEYTVEIRDTFTGCKDSHTVHVEVLPNLSLVASAEEPLICMGDSTTVHAELLPVLDTDPYEIPFSLTWSTEDGAGFFDNVAGGEHYVTATNACGSAIAVAVVQEEYCGCHVWIPNAFTPDGDGLNEGFKIESSCEWDVFSFQIFNRWGELVWATNDADQPWDGGAPELGDGEHYLPDGWYPYIVRWEYREAGKLSRKQKVGRVLVVR